MKPDVVHVCSFTSFEAVTSRTTYKELKTAVLEAGRFSVFEATESMRAARMYTKLCNDPEVETVEMPFPWTGVKLKKKAKKR